jgi:type III restriction enzyme
MAKMKVMRAYLQTKKRLKMYILKEFQEKAVTQLLDLTFDALQEPRPQTEILLEAPTGSGKTIMMASLIERIIEEVPMQQGLPNEVAFIWIAPHTLHIQSYNALKKLYSDANKLRCVDLSEMGTNPVLNNRELLFVNWSTIDKEKNVWRKENESNTNIETLIENTKAEGVKIILVIDEAHLSAFSGRQAIAVRRLIGADVEILITATPNFQRPQRSISVPRRKVVEEEMIKKGVRLNIGLDPEDQNGENVHIHLLRTAFNKKQELQGLYNEELGENVLNPLILIQLPSDNSALSDEDRSIREILEGLLNAEYGISTNNGRLAIWLSGERDKDGLEEMNGFQDVLIFKQAIAQGWDCPRATILVNYRNINSPVFGIQTVGRILRMPHQRHYRHDDLNYGYVYSNIESNQIILVPSDTDYFEKHIALRQDDRGWTFEVIAKSIIVNDRPAAGVLTSVFENKFFLIMEQWYGITQLPDIDLFTPANLDQVAEQREANKQALIQKGWEFDIDVNQIRIPTNVDFDPYEVNAILISNSNLQNFAITTAQFSEMFDAFCFANITRLNRSKSWKKMRETLIHFAEYYLGIFEIDARVLFLYPQNKAILVQHIAAALESFDLWQKARGNARRRVELDRWAVPELRYYSELYTRDNVDIHALKPYYELQAASTAEKSFKRFLIENAEHLEWWYKNGDSGTEHFSVHYTNSQMELKLFFVDYIIKFKNGVYGLFDTKTKRSDLEAHNKHNGLLEYLEAQNAIVGMERYIGGVLIPEEIGGVITFRYCRNRIQDTADLTGWDFFNPATINQN